MTREEMERKAREIAQDYEGGCFEFSAHERALLSGLILSALVEAREGALEEAAGVALEFIREHREDQKEYGFPHGEGLNYFCENYGCGSMVEVAQEIRALKAQGGGGKREG